MSESITTCKHGISVSRICQKCIDEAIGKRNG